MTPRPPHPLDPRPGLISGHRIDCLALAAAAPALPIALACFALAGICDGPLLAATLTVRQREAPPERLGQVNTAGGSLKLRAGTLGAALTAALADLLGAPMLLLAMGAIQIVAAGLGLVRRHLPAGDA